MPPFPNNNGKGIEASTMEFPHTKWYASHQESLFPKRWMVTKIILWVSQESSFRYKRLWSHQGSMPSSKNDLLQTSLNKLLRGRIHNEIKVFWCLHIAPKWNPQPRYIPCYHDSVILWRERERERERDDNLLSSSRGELLSTTFILDNIKRIQGYS